MGFLCDSYVILMWFLYQYRLNTDAISTQYRTKDE